MSSKFSNSKIIKTILPGSAADKVVSIALWKYNCMAMKWK